MQISPIAIAGGGCEIGEITVDKSILNPGDSFTVNTSYKIYDIDSKILETDPFIPYISFGSDIAELSKRFNYLGKDDYGVSKYSITIQVPKGISGNRRYQSLVKNICGSQNLRLGPSIAIGEIGAQVKTPWCSVLEVRVGAETIFPNQDLNISSQIASNGTIAEPEITARLLDEVATAKVISKNKTDLVQNFEAVIKFNKIIDIDMDSIIRVRVPGMCEGYGFQEIIEKQIKIGNEVGISRRSMLTGGVTINTFSRDCTEVNSKMTVYNIDNVAQQYICAKSERSLIPQWISPSTLEALQNKINDFKKQNCSKAGQTIHNSYGKFTCGAKNGNFYWMDENELSELIAREEADREINQEKMTKAIETVNSSIEKKSQTSAKIKTTISCIKGKTTKKVSAVSPKCPFGYKKR